MISWIQRTFQHHFKLVFGVLLGITIISFIITIGATPGIGRGERRVTTRDFFGYNLASREDMSRLINDAGLSLELQIGGSGGVDDDQVKNYAMERAAALHLADEWHIPQATTAEETAFIRGLRMFAGKTGEFDAERYATFRANLSATAQTTEGDIARVINEDVRVQKVEQLLDGPGYVLPDDVKGQLVVGDTTWTVATASVDFASFHPEITPTEDELAKFYHDNDVRYQVPAQTVASAIDFPAADYTGQVTGVTDPKIKLERAQRLAMKAASDTAYTLYEAKLSPGPGLDGYFASHKISLKPLAAFSAETGPAELKLAPDVAASTSTLDAQHYFSEALPTPTGAALLIWKDSLPAHKPLLAEVRAKVQADYIDNERRKRFAELGRNIRGFVETRLKAGDSFDKAAGAAAKNFAVKIDTKAFPAFTLRTRPKDFNESAIGALESLSKGQVSEMTIEGDKGELVYAIDKKLPSLNENSPQFAQARASMATYLAHLSASSYLSELATQELKRTEPAVK